MLWFLGISVALVVVPPSYFNGNCTSATYFSQLQNYTVSAQSAICSSNCQCYFSSTAQAAYPASMAATLAAAAPNTTTTDTSQPVNSQSCSSTGWNSSGLTGAATLMAYLEPLLSCTSWCNQTSSPLVIYRFSDVNKGTEFAYFRNPHCLLLRHHQHQSDRLQQDRLHHRFHHDRHHSHGLPVGLVASLRNRRRLEPARWRKSQRRCHPDAPQLLIRSDPPFHKFV